MKPFLIFCILLSSLCGVSVASTTSTAQSTLSLQNSPGGGFNQSVLNYINEMRANPREFYYKYVEPYIQQKKGRFTTQYTRSLKKDMLSSPALPLFTENDVLENTATQQGNYLARFKGQRLTHDQGNLDFAGRMEKAGLHCLAENLYTDDDPDPLNMVLDLLIDQGIPSFGHRKNLMSPMYTQIGIINTTPKGGRTIVVMDFGCKIP